MKKFLAFATALMLSIAAFGQTYPSPTYNVLTLQTPLAATSGGTGANTALAATSNLQFQSTATGAVARSLASKFNDVINGRDFGMKCDGTTNDNTAFATALAAIKPFTQLVLPAGRCLFSTPKTLPVISNGSLVGAGSGQTQLVYTGAAGGTSDVITLGDGTTSLSGWVIRGFSGVANNAQSGGAFLRLRRMQNGNTMFDVNVPSSNFYDGIWLDNVNVFYYTNFTINVQHAGLKMNGAATSDEGSDIFLDNGLVTNSGIGYWVGGGQGGVYFGKTLTYGNGVNFQIDNGIAARKNREIFFSDQSVSDGSSSYGVWINDTLTSNAPIVMNGAFGSAGLIGPITNVPEIYVQSWPSGRITMGAGQLYNATGDGFRIADATTIVSIDPARHIFNNTGYGINATVATSNIGNYSQYMVSNAAGNMSANVSPMPFRGSFDSIMNYTASTTAGQQRGLFWTANNLTRWKWSSDGTAEAGSNAGSNLLLARYSDAGAFIDSPISVARNTGIVTIPDGLVLKGTTVNPILSGTSASIGGTALAIGACFSTTVTIAGATTAMVATTSPVTYPGDAYNWRAYVSAANTVTVLLCTALGGTPTASTYNVRLLQ